MTVTIFFSWQADTPTLTGRNFIERTLEKALDQLVARPELQPAIRDELKIDRDTKGVPGQPPILETIFKKIDAAAVFVPDFTFVGARRGGRPMPNPNVLIEYGYALKSLGHARIVALMNTAYGGPSPENMPFDLAYLRFPICYCLTEEADEVTRKGERKRLAGALREAILAVLESDDFTMSLPKMPAPGPFHAVEPLEGRSRFRRQGEALGKRLDHFTNMAKEDVCLSPGPSVWLRVMPISDPGNTLSIPKLLSAASSGSVLAPLLSASGWSFLRAADGVGAYPVHDPDMGTTGGVAFAFCPGEIWAIDTYALNPLFSKNVLPVLEAEFSSALRRYASFLGTLGIQPPYKWIAGMEGVQGREIYLSPPPGGNFVNYGPHGNCLSDVIVEEGQYTPELAAGEALMPFFRKVFEACALERPKYYPTPK